MLGVERNYVAISMNCLVIHTRLILDIFSPCELVTGSLIVHVSVILKTAWDRDDSEFILVAATVRLLFP